ncbi:MAG: P-II family nitrogen regulator [Burkholderiales bacterium]
MKEIVAILRVDAMNRTKAALVQAGVSSFFARRVLGRGKGRVDFRVVTGAEEGREEAIAHLKDDGPMLLPKRLVHLVVPDAKVERAVHAIIEANRTGHPGDGRIFVLPVAETIRIRTGERAEAALQED